MKLDEQIAQLNNHAWIIGAMTAKIPPEQAIWQPDPDSWSMAQVMNHMVREEREDFRARLAAGLGLSDPSEPQPDAPHDPNDLAAHTTLFVSERERSLKWLNSLNTFDWDTKCAIHGGQISAGDMVVSWVAHDLLHMRQLVELLYAYTAQQAAPYSVRYAG